MAKAKKINMTAKARALMISCSAKLCSDVEIAKALGVNRIVLNRWRREDPELADEMFDARLPAVDDVEAAAYKSALGYTYTETVTDNVTTKGGRLKAVSTKIHKKHMAPNAKMIQFILTNRRTLRWRKAEKTEIERGGTLYVVKLPE